MRKIILAVVVALVALCGVETTTVSANTPGYQTPWGVSAHSPTFGLPPQGVPIISAPKTVETIQMYDSVSTDVIPRTAPAVAGYVSGSWPTFNILGELFPHAVRVSVTPQAIGRAKCLDVEWKDAVPQQVYGWVKMELRLGAYMPCIYSSLSEMPQIKEYLTTIPRDDYLLWDADWTNYYHLDAGYDATQYTSHALGRNLDGSAASVRFLTLTKPKPKKPAVKCVVPKNLTGHTIASARTRLRAAHCAVGRIDHGPVNSRMLVWYSRPRQGTSHLKGSKVNLFLEEKVA